MRKLLLFLAMAAVVTLLALLVLRAQQPPTGPRQVHYDREACAHCHMLISDPRFAAQAIDTDGEVHVFDDPGCMLSFFRQRQVRASWVSVEGAWTPLVEASFIEVRESPMGFGLAAAPAGTQGALSPEAVDLRIAGARQP
jgi:hypothetical protein